MTGAKAAFDAAAADRCASGDPALAATIAARFSDVETALRPYRQGDGYVSLHRRSTRRDARRLSQAVDALAEPLSQVAAQLVV